MMVKKAAKGRGKTSARVGKSKAAQAKRGTRSTAAPAKRETAAAKSRAAKRSSSSEVPVSTDIRRAYKRMLLGDYLGSSKK